MTASATEVEAAQKEMGCRRLATGHDSYAECRDPSHIGEWDDDRGCPVAVAVADAVVAAAQPRIAAETLRGEADRFDRMGGMLTCIGVALRLREAAREAQS